MCHAKMLDIKWSNLLSAQSSPDKQIVKTSVKVYWWRLRRLTMVSETSKDWKILVQKFGKNLHYRQIAFLKNSNAKN